MKRVLCVIGCLFGATGEVAADCRAAPPATAAVVEILDGETLLLDNGQAVRLAEVLTPWRQDRGGVAVDLRGAMERALADMVLGKRIGLRAVSDKRDRYGRIIAHVYTEGGVWVQGALAVAGHVRAASAREARLCARAVQHNEAAARAAKAGLWGSGLFSVRPAGSTAELVASAGTFQIVEGTIKTVARVRDRIFLNFGDKWREDFTVGLRATTLETFAGSDLEQPFAASRLEALRGRTLRVRGWIESYNGPFITLSHPEQIELTPQAGEIAVDAGPGPETPFDNAPSARF